MRGTGAGRDLGDLSGIESGVRNTRMPGDEVSAAVRAEQQRDAWRYLNRCFTPEEAAELADILGVTPTPAAVAEVKRTRSASCTVSAPSRFDTTTTGWCRACDRTYRLDSHGRLRPHPAWKRRRGADVRLSSDCKGSGRRPEEVE